MQLSLSPSKLPVTPNVNSTKNEVGALHEYIVGSPNLDDVESHLDCPNQVFKGTAFLRTLPSVPSESLNLITDCPFEPDSSPLDGFHIEGLSPSKMTRVL